MALNINNELYYILIEEQLNKNEAELIKYINENKKEINNINNLKKYIKNKDLNNLLKNLYKQNIIDLDVLSIKFENILNILKYPKYLFLVNILFGEISMKIVEYLFEKGQCSFNSILKYFNIINDEDFNIYKKNFNILIENNIIIELIKKNEIKIIKDLNSNKKNNIYEDYIKSNDLYVRIFY
jgi:hypothetical protein